MDRSMKFWDKIAQRYSKQPVADEAAYQNKLKLTQEYLRPDMEVLEFGCGTGSTALIHAPHVKHIRAIDVSAKMLEIARRKADAAKIANVSFEQAAIEDLRVPDQTLDAVLGLSILHLLENRDEVIARVHRMLKPGGIFVSSTACLGDTMLKYIKLIGPIGELLGLMPPVKVFTEKELERSLTGAGFQIAYRWQPGTGKAVFIIARKGARQ